MSTEAKSRASRDDEMAALFTEQDFPWAWNVAGRDRLADFAAVVRFAREHGMGGDLETRIERHVQDLGGRVEGMIDPWTAIPRLISRLFGGHPEHPRAIVLPGKQAPPA